MDHGTRVCEFGRKFDIENACGKSNKMAELDSDAIAMEHEEMLG